MAEEFLQRGEVLHSFKAFYSLIPNVDRGDGILLCRAERSVVVGVEVLADVCAEGSIGEEVLVDGNARGRKHRVSAALLAVHIPTLLVGGCQLCVRRVAVALGDTRLHQTPHDQLPFFLPATVWQIVDECLHVVACDAVLVAVHFFQVVVVVKVEAGELVFLAMQGLQGIEVFDARQVGDASVADVDDGLVQRLVLAELSVVVGVAVAADIPAEGVVGEVSLVDGDGQLADVWIFPIFIICHLHLPSLLPGHEGLSSRTGIVIGVVVTFNVEISIHCRWQAGHEPVHGSA